MKDTKWYYSEKFMRYSGISKNFIQRQDGALEYKMLNEDAIFITDLYYNDDNDLSWNTFSLDISENAVFRIYIKIFQDDYELTEYDKAEDINKKYEYLKNNADIMSDYGDILLYSNDKKGMYLAACIYFYQKGEKIQFNSFSISYPKSSFTSYLPAIYEGNPKLERYIAVFENIYMMLEKEIDELPYKLDIDFANSEGLKDITAMLGFCDKYLPDSFNEEILRVLLKEWVLLNKVKGVAYYYKRIVQIFAKTDIVITDSNLKILDNNDMVKGLFYVFYSGDSIYKTWVIKFLKIERPLFTKYKFIDINTDNGLSRQCYLGISSLLS